MPACDPNLLLQWEHVKPNDIGRALLDGGERWRRREKGGWKEGEGTAGAEGTPGQPEEGGVKREREGGRGREM